MRVHRVLIPAFVLLGAAIVLAVPGLSFADIAEAGAQRVSVGGALTWVAAKAMADAATAIRDSRANLLRIATVGRSSTT